MDFFHKNLKDVFLATLLTSYLFKETLTITLHGGGLTLISDDQERLTHIVQDYSAWGLELKYDEHQGFFITLFNHEHVVKFLRSFKVDPFTYYQQEGLILNDYLKKRDEKNNQEPSEKCLVM